MEASFVDLRKKSRQIARALGRRERVTLLYRGRPTAVIEPLVSKGSQPGGRAQDQPACGLWADRTDMKDVRAYVRKLRRGRFHAF